MTRIPLFTLNALGAIAPIPMTVFFLLFAFHANQKRLAEFHVSLQRESRIEARQERHLIGLAVVSPRLPNANPSYAGARLISSVALPRQRHLTLSYGGAVLALSDQGRDIRLNGSSIDQMSRQDLLRDLHVLGRGMIDQGRPDEVASRGGPSGLQIVRQFPVPPIPSAR